MPVLFYIRDEVEGYTEDFCVQGCIIEIIDEKGFDEKITYSLHGIELEKHHTVSHWTLLPESPTPWRL
jgi:hypothetical protein